MMVVRANFIAAAAEVVAELAFHIRPDIRLAAAGAGEEHCRGGRLCALDPFGVIVRHLGSEPRQMQRLLHILRQLRRSGNPHGAAVSIAVVGPWSILIQPAVEVRAIAPAGIGAAQLLHLTHKRCFDGCVVLPARVQQRLCHSQRHDRIVGKFRTLAKERKVLCLIIVEVEFIGAADDIAQNCAVHI